MKTKQSGRASVVLTVTVSSLLIISASTAHATVILITIVLVAGGLMFASRRLNLKPIKATVNSK